MRKMLTAKFAIPRYREALLACEERIAEGTRHPSWGIDLTASHSTAFDPNTWTGKDELGKMLTELRKEIAKDAGVT